MWKPTSIDRLRAVDLLEVVLERLRERVPGACMAEVEVRRRAAEAAEDVPEVKVVAGDGAADDISRCVCGSIAPGRRACPVASITLSAVTSSDPRERHRAVVDVDVADVVVRRGDDAASLDQDRHASEPPLQK
jgi:hypothetical protein